MKKNMKKVLTLGILGMFMVMFAMSFVVAADSTPVESTDGVFVTLWKAFFGGINFGGDDEGIGSLFSKDGLATLLIIFLVVMLVYDITSILPFFNSKDWIKWVFSIVFGILAFLFVNPKEIAVLVSTYQAVGVTIVAVIPFIVIWAFVWKLEHRAEEETKPSYSMFGKMIWGFFGAYLLFQWNKLRNAPETANSPVLMAYLVLAVVAIVLVFMQSKIYAWLRKGSLKKLRSMGIKKGERNQIRALRNRIQEINDALRNPENTIDMLEELQKEKDSLEKAIGVIGG